MVVSDLFLFRCMESSALGADKSGVNVLANSFLFLACFGGLQASPAGGLAIYGDIMFKSQFVAFNGGNQSLGMANHV